MQHLNTVTQMLLHKTPEFRAQGRELLSCLGERERQAVIAWLIDAPRVRWGLAARCLLSESIAEERLRTFRICCALYKLERERLVGREPLESAWIAVEWASIGRQASFHQEDWRLRKEIWATMEPEFSEPELLTFREDELNLERIPDGWGAHAFQAGDSPKKTTTPFLGWRADEIVGRLKPLLGEPKADPDEEDQSREAHRAASCALFGGWARWARDTVEGYPPAESLHEWRWQHALWLRVVQEGQEGLSMIYSTEAKYPCPTGGR